MEGKAATPLAMLPSAIPDFETKELHVDGHYLHLLINHIPILGIPASILVLLYGLLRKQKEILRLGLLVMLVSGGVAFPAMKTGHEAEEKVEHLAGVSEHWIEKHEDVGETATWLAVAAAGLALVGLLIQFINEKGATRVAILALVVGLGAGYFLALTGQAGGRIRRPELRPKTTGAQGAGERESHEGREHEGREDDEHETRRPPAVKQPAKQPAKTPEGGGNKGK